MHFIFGPKMANTLVLVLTLLLCVDISRTRHFFGATIRWKSDPETPNTATFFWKAGWLIGRGPCGQTCDTSRVGTFGSATGSNGGIRFDNGAWECKEGCSDADDANMSIPITYWITGVNEDDGYEMGENEFTHTFAGPGPFYIGFTGGDWRLLDIPDGPSDPKWNVWTRVIFGDRSDTGKPNSSPLSASLPVYRIKFDCTGSVQLPLVDPDGDTVKCRWGATEQECHNVCNGLPGVSIDKDTCRLSIDATSNASYTPDGWYVAAIILEDFPRTTIDVGGTEFTPNDALSKVPVQFLIQTPTYDTTCEAKPVFVWPTPEQDSVYYLQPTESLGISVYAINELDTTATIVDIQVVTPPGVLLSVLQDDDHARARVKFIVVYWTPLATQSGANTICFKAIDSNGRTGDYRCVYIYANDINECEPQPCQNGGVCNNLENLYTCDCLPGTAGYNCTDDTEDNCATSPCQNGATCTDAFNAFTCACVDGYSGDTCDVDIDECVSAPCYNGATCVDQVDQFSCTCASGFEGSQCNQATDECDSSPCQNGATCVDLIDSYLCICILGFQGTNCQLDIDECSSSPCKNGGACGDGVNSYNCSCQPGYSGSFCECDINECASDPCQNGATCRDEVNGYNCTCSAGWFGAECTLNIDECASSPCLNSGTCTDGVNSYTCACEPGWTGDQCQLDINECASGPCYNGATCIDQLDQFSCTCASGFEGTQCDQATDECDSSPCQNGATCVDLVDSYLCVCSLGFQGTDCQLDVDECSSSPCENGGGCTDGINSYTCSCQPGYSGSFCERDINECASDPCQNGAACGDEVNGYSCTCSAGWFGAECSLNTDECTSSPCLNSGTCTDGVNSYTCACEPGWMGDQCQLDINECASIPCQNDGVCIDGANSYSCDCTPGFNGINCQLNIIECDSSPCLNSGTCIDGVNSYTCACEPGWTGDQCQLEFNECASIPCQNDGVCIDGANSYSCDCAPGFNGINCQLNIIECDSSLCQNGATCTNQTTSYQCSCKDGYRGVNCEENIDDCYLSPCMNNGTCVDGENGFTCDCLPHWFGERCEQTDQEYCRCEHDTEWMRTGFSVNCECVTDGRFTRYASRYDQRLPCDRNLYVLIIMAVAGMVVAALIPAIYYLVKDMRRRYHILLNGGDPDNDKLIGSTKTLDTIPTASRPSTKLSRVSHSPTDESSSSGMTPIEKEDLVEKMKLQYLTNNKHYSNMMSSAARKTPRV